MNITPTIIILGAAQYDGHPSRVLAARLDHAVLLSVGTPCSKAPHVITVGSKLPGDRFTEAEVSRRYLIEHGIPEENITAVPHGCDTRGSLEAVKACIESGSPVTIVTDPMHVVRAYLIARDVGIRARVSPTRTSPQRFPGTAWWRYLLHEGGGLIVYGLEKTTNPTLASRTRSILHKFEGFLRPSRKIRHIHLRRQGPC